MKPSNRKELLSKVRRSKEEEVFGGMTFLIKDKMCNDLIVRLASAQTDELLTKKMQGFCI